MKYFIEVSYLGTNFHGWQIQPNDNSVQEDLETALSMILGEKIQINGSSRTDAGVHSRQQYAHFETTKKIKDLEALKIRLNKFINKDLAVNNIILMAQNCHSRFDAESRKYIYRISNHKDPFFKDFQALYYKNLDIDKMNEACQYLFKYINFKSFSRVRTEVKTFECTIEEAYWVQKTNVLEFHIKANRFLRGMVRAIVGTLLDVGSGKLKVAEFEQIILAQDRTKAGIAAKPEGLTLEEVNYPENYFEMETKIVQAENDDLETVRSLFTEYQTYLGISLCFQGFQEELDNLPGKYADPQGVILLAKVNEETVGIVALRKMESGVCEMKRLYVIPKYHGYGIGNLLVTKIIESAIIKGYQTMKLDTLARLESAVKLYKNFGFVETSAYNVNPETDILYFEKTL